jgi:hypothetical protein
VACANNGHVTDIRVHTLQMMFIARGIAPKRYTAMFGTLQLMIADIGTAHNGVRAHLAKINTVLANWTAINGMERYVLDGIAPSGAQSQITRILIAEDHGIAQVGMEISAIIGIARYGPLEAPLRIEIIIAPAIGRAQLGMARSPRRSAAII